MQRLAFLGPRATFAEQALLSLPESDGAELVAAVSTAAALAAARDGSVHAALVPIENSVEGAVPATLDGLDEDPALVIIREALLRVRFAVMTRPGTALADITTIASHPHGEAQTRRWLAANLPAAHVSLTPSTAEAAAAVARGELDAAVAAPLAATQHGLDIVADDIGDVPDAITRFVLVAPPGPVPAPTGADRTSLVATVVNRPGALLDVLTELSVRGIDLTRIESRPTRDRLGEYRFFIDCAGHISQAAVGDALAALHRRCTRLRYLGSYPRADDGCRHPSAPHTRDEDFAGAASWLAAVRAGKDA